MFAELAPSSHSDSGRSSRMFQAFEVVRLYAIYGPLFGAFLFMLVGAGHMSMQGVGPVELLRRGPTALIIAPFFILGAFVIAFAPAALTGLVLAVERYVRGRISWLAAIVVPLAFMLAYDRIYGGTIFCVTREFVVAIGVGSSLTIRYFFRKRVG